VIHLATVDIRSGAFTLLRCHISSFHKVSDIEEVSGIKCLGLGKMAAEGKINAASGSHYRDC
jgi:hypothetical protein